MDIEHLKLFIRLATTHNISSAGREMGLSPAVASAHINKLEQGLGVRLLHRTTRMVSLTEEGQAFLPHAEEVLASVDTARAAVGAGEAVPTGTLRVTAPASFGTMHLVPALQGFLARYSELSVDFRFTDAVVDLVEGGFDIAIRNGVLRDSTLVARKLADDRRIICAAPGYLEKFGEPQTPQDLLEHQCITMPGLETWSFETPAGRQSIKAKGHFRSDNGTAIRDACVAGVGITISSMWSVFQQLQRGELVQVLPNFPFVSEAAIWAVYPSSRLVAPKVRVFIDYLSEYFGKPPYWMKTAV